MASPRRPSSLSRLRLLLLVLVVAVVGAVWGLFLFGRAGRPERARPVPGLAGGGAGPEQGVVTLGEGFQYTHFDGEREAFSIRADRMLEDRRETVFLEGAQITITDEQGTRWVLAAERASYSRETQDSHLEGAVHLEGGNGMTLNAPALELQNEGRTLVSSGAVAFGYQGLYRGTAQRLRAYLPEQSYTLAGQVEVHSAPGAPEPMTLAAERVVLERDQQVLIADGGVRVTRGGDFLEAQEVQLHLTPDLDRLRFLRAREAVRVRRVEPPAAGGGAAGPSPPAVTEGAGLGLVLVTKPDGRRPEDLQLEGSPAEKAVLVLTTPEQARTTLKAGYMTSKFDDDGSQRLRFFGGLELDEEEAPGPGGEGVARRLLADRARAVTGADGELHEVAVAGGVEYRDERIQAWGERMVYNAAEGQGELFGMAEGEPVEGSRQRVQVVSQGGELLAPAVRYARAQGILQGHGGVSARLDQVGPLEGTPLGRGEGPVRVEAKESFLRDSPRSFLFRGGARAWRGDNLLLAEWIRGDTEEHKLTAGGGVRTVWQPTGGADGTTEGQPLVVVARELTYLEDQELIYQGNVQSEQEGRRLTCDELTATLDPQAAVEEMTCRGAVRLVDEPMGRSAEADTALYHPQQRRMELYGQPAVVRNRDGTRLEAPILEYDLAQGRVEARSATAAAAPGGGKP